MTATAARGQRGRQETTAIVLLLVGGFLWGIGWLVGVVLLWLSDAWSLRDKLLGTLVVPGGLALPLVLIVRLGIGGTDGPLWAALLLALAAGSVATAVRLARVSV